MKKQFRTVLIAVTCAACALVVTPAHGARRSWTAAHVRSGNDRVVEALQYGLEHSPSYHDLIDTLELLDGVVFIEGGPCGHRGPRACLHLMSTRGGRLRVRIDPRQPIPSVAAQLAHELYHAVEVARELDVIDEVSLRNLYARIGERSCGSESDDCWETRAADAFEALASRQLTAVRPTSEHQSHGALRLTRPFPTLAKTEETAAAASR